MVKHTQIPRRQLANQLFGVFHHFVGLATKEIKLTIQGFL